MYFTYDSSLLFAAARAEFAAEMEMKASIANRYVECVYIFNRYIDR